MSDSDVKYLVEYAKQHKEEVELDVHGNATERGLRLLRERGKRGFIVWMGGWFAKLWT